MKLTIHNIVTLAKNKLFMRQVYISTVYDANMICASTATLKNMEKSKWKPT
jgi:hypothetical protein